MNSILFVLSGVAIAALIGGLTNYLAIRMLFHPRRPISVAGFKLPFTPGLIPKRKDEIARSLGKVVAEYLVTSRGISALLGREAFLKSAEEKLKESLRALARREETVEELCRGLWGGQRWDEVKLSFAAELETLAEKTLDRLWLEQGWAEKTVGDFLAGWPPQAREAFVRQAARWIGEAAREELRSPGGDRLIREAAGRLLAQAGGFLGALAGIFMDEDKMAAKVRLMIGEALASAPVQSALGRFVDGLLRKIEQLRLKEAAALLIGDEADAGPGQWVASRLSAQLKLKAKQWLGMKPGELLDERLPWIEERIPALTRLAVRVLERRIDRVLEAVELPALVEEQVKDFPVDRLERIILDISGREFRAITWLGALLGGMIGLVQALILQWIS